MKPIQNFLTLALLMVLMSCGNGKKSHATAPTDGRNIATSEMDQTDFKRNATDNSVTATTQRNNDSSDRSNNTPPTERMSSTSSTNNWNDQDSQEVRDYDKSRMTNLYKHLNLSADQIAKYESTSKQDMDTWRRKNPNSTLNKQQRVQLEDQRMKSFLDSKQYKSYQQWVRDNPYKY